MNDEQALWSSTKSKGESIPKKMLTRMFGGPSKQRRKKRPQAKKARSSQVVDTAITPNPKRFGDWARTERRRSVKAHNHRGAYKGTPQNNTTIECPGCGEARDADKVGGGWKQCNTCGVKVR